MALNGANIPKQNVNTENNNECGFSIDGVRNVSQSTTIIIESTFSIFARRRTRADFNAKCIIIFIDVFCHNQFTNFTSEIMPTKK